MLIKDSFKTIALSLIVLSLVGVAYAWTEPTNTPPTGNVATPINTTGGQIVEGGLVLGNSAVANGLIVKNGNVGIGTTTPGAKLEIKDGKQRFSQTFTAYNTNGPYSWCQTGRCPSGQGGNPSCTCQNNTQQTTSTCTYNSYSSGGNNFFDCVFSATIQAQDITKIVECGVNFDGTFSCTTIQ